MWQDSELGYGLRRPSGYPIHDRRTSAPFRTEGRPSGATHWQWHYGGPDVLSPEEEAELEALRLQAAHLRQEALREETSKDGLERQVELLRREYRFALDEQHRLLRRLRSPGHPSLVQRVQKVQLRRSKPWTRRGDSWRSF